MTSIEDKVRDYMRGDIRAKFVSSDGMEVPLISAHNTISYAAADAVAAAYGGDVSMVPKYVGFIYGPDANPPSLSDPTNRYMEWSDVKAEVKAFSGNIQIARFSFKPTISAPAKDDEDGDSNDSNDEESYYNGNAVTFHACTRSGDAGKYAFDTSRGSGFAKKFGNGMYIYHAMLLSPKTDCECEEREYNILARVSLYKNGYRKKPKDYELALDWCVTFF